MIEPLGAGAEEARVLFSYAGAWAPPPAPGQVGWGARAGRKSVGGARREGERKAAGSGEDDGERLVGAVFLERSGPAGIVQGPVVVEGADPVEIAAELLAALLAHAGSLGVETLFARPQGLDRVWVRFGFIPVPEADLPRAFKNRPGTGLFAWRGGTALWSSRKPARTEAPLT